MPCSRKGLTVAVVRGGSWNNNDHNARCAYRNNNEPENHNNNLGFRSAKISSMGRKAAVHGRRASA